MMLERKLGWVRRMVPLALSLALFATTAGAAPLDVFFTGPTIASDPLTSYGISEADALSAQADFGIQIVEDPSFIGLVTGTLAANPSFEPVPTLTSDEENRAFSSWTVDNVSAHDLAGATYLLFTHTDPYSVDGTLVDYADSNVGLTIDAALGWVIVKAVDPTAGAFYYPAILLDRSIANPLDGMLASGATSSAFDVSYVVKQALTEAPVGSGAFHLPELQLGMAFTPVPEPSSAALLALGLVTLAARRRG